MTARQGIKSSAALRKTTGRDYAEWFDVLDAMAATTLPSKDVVRRLIGEHRLSRWWAQKLVVEYEQHQGLRTPGSRHDGTITITVSRTITGTTDQVFTAVVDPRQRSRWAPDLDLRPRTTRHGRSARFDVADGTRINVVITESDRQRTQIAVEHERLADTNTAADAKAAWKARLTQLRDHLDHETTRQSR